MSETRKEGQIRDETVLSSSEEIASCLEKVSEISKTIKWASRGENLENRFISFDPPRLDELTLVSKKKLEACCDEIEKISKLLQSILNDVESKFSR